MNLKFWQKKNDNQKTTISVQAFEGGVQQIYVEAQSPEAALDVWRKVKSEVIKK